MVLIRVSISMNIFRGETLPLEIPGNDPMK